MSEPTAEQELSLDRRLDEAILAGIRQGHARKQRLRRRHWRRSTAAIACGLALIACLFTIRVSPVFASMLRDIPGFEKFVDMIDRSGDRGLKFAADNDLVQPVGLSDEHDGGKFTVEGIIADQSRMVVFYELDNEVSDEPLQLVNPRLTDGQDGKLQTAIGWQAGETAQEDGHTIVRGTLDISIQEGEQWPNDVRLTVGTQAPSETSGPNLNPNVASLDNAEPNQDLKTGGEPRYTVAFPIDKRKFAGLVRNYALDKTIEVEGQRIVFERAVVSPLRISLYMSCPQDNAKQIFGVGDIRLMDESGSVWNYVGGSGSACEQKIYFESNYFHQPKHLSIQGNWFRALEKSKLQVVIDTEQKQILQAPDDRLKLEEIGTFDSHTMVRLTLEGIPEEDRLMYDVLDPSFKDASGAAFVMGDGLSNVVSTYTDSSQPGKRFMNYYLPDRSYKQPLTFTLLEYPDYIRAPYEIRIW